VRSPLIALAMLAGSLFPAGVALGAPLQKPATRGSGGIGIRLVDVPTDSRDPRARSYVVDRVAPGTSIRRRVEIVNTTRSTADVVVYPAAADLRGSRFAFAPGHSRNELSDWTSVSRGVLRLPPGAKALETLTIDVPANASSGERYAVVWAEVSAPAPSAGGVTLVNRVGVRMYVSIGPGGGLPSNFVIDSLTAKRSTTGAPLVVAELHNTGPRTLDIGGNLTLAKGPGGLRAGPLPVPLGAALAPGDSQRVTVRIDRRLPRGPWRAELRLESGSILRAAVATITFPRAAAAASARPRQLMLVVIILLLLLAAAACALLLSGRRPRGDVEPAAAS
jgi:hypothetical protein